MTIGNISIDLSLKNIWRSWFAFRKGKKPTSELDSFQYYLEKNLYNLFVDLNSGSYCHGGYRKFIVCDNKRREISVADVRDKIVHRLVYDYPNGYIWKCDVKKFFDSIDHEILQKLLVLKIKDKKTSILLNEIIRSFQYGHGSKKGMPIGNLTSQIFANIYMNELDRFVKHQLEPKAYLRYGDDFILVAHNTEKLGFYRTEIIKFLDEVLKLQVNAKNDRITKVSHGLKFLGATIFPSCRMLSGRNFRRIRKNLNIRSISSYSGLVRKNGDEKQKEQFNWMVLRCLSLE